MFSYQLYTSRNHPPLVETLKMAADIGFDGIEGYGGVYADDAQVADLAANLSRFGLTMPTAHFGIDQLEKSPEKVLDIAKKLGIKRIYCPYIVPEDRPNDAAGWKAWGARLGKAAKPFRAAGYGFGWHNHDFEVTALPDGTFPQDAIFAGDPDLQWEIDVAWVTRGGADPVKWIEKYAPRITAAHIKDIAPKGQNLNEDGWADVGHGTIDWAPIWAALKKTPCDVFILEHDNPSEPARFARRSLETARTF
ncbi:MAG: xylose isomerase [Cereibacter sphaeroides]|uniref:Xylose isomerase n=1 Tax=Cereibacter sphaeroides TaxID=1063 RepID=A0A2W5S993_CERSP|nr:MAG: xylose isomerase [Cereibacter sphaeroides]